MRLVVLFFIVAMMVPAFGQVNVMVNDTLEPNQADDLRIGFHISFGRTRYSADFTNNLLGPTNFEDGGNWGLFQYTGEWGLSSNPSGVTLSLDSSAGNFMHGKSSQKIAVTSGSAVPLSMGQYQSYKEFQVGPTYEFSCYMKQQGLTQNPRLRIRYQCPEGLVDRFEEFPVSDSWQKYAFRFSFNQKCAPADPIQGSGSSTRVDVLSTGTLWVDSCQLVDLNDTTDWGLSARMIEAVKKLRPGTIRWGGLSANPIAPNNIMVSNPFEATLYQSATGGYGSQTMTLNQFMKLTQLSGADPQWVLSQRFSMQDHTNFFEYLFGPESSVYGSKRTADGYGPWTGKFKNWFFELGNELLCCPSDSCTPLASGAPLCANGSNQLLTAGPYADWSTARINHLKNNPHWDLSKMKVGFGTWYFGKEAYSRLTLTEEAANTNGGKGDFLLTAEYYPDNPSAYYTTPTTNASKNPFSNATDYYNVIMGESAYGEKILQYHLALSQASYTKQLPYGFYEAGAAGTKTAGTQFNLETSQGFGISAVDLAVNMRRIGMLMMGSFALNGLGWSWGYMDNYPVLKKRPSYYLSEMYGSFTRGKMLTTTLSGNIMTFDPYGPAAGSVTIPGMERYPQTYPQDVPEIAVYPFKYNNRYSFLIINRSQTNTIPVSLSLPYSPSSTAQIHFVTADSIQANNNTTETVKLQHQTVSNFSNNYTVQAKPFSAYVIVNYAASTTVCLDEDQDGYGANEYEIAQCSASTTKVDCDDVNPRIKPDNSNAFCDCNPSDGYYIGGFEITDSIDNDCDGTVDDLNGPVQPPVCLDSDHDNYTSATCGGSDCDDSNASIHPNQTEVCSDLRDNDCNGKSDCNDASCSQFPACLQLTCTDADNDGYGSANLSQCANSQLDCVDTNALINPGRTEVCGNGVDEDCNAANDLCPAGPACTLNADCNSGFLCCNSACRVSACTSDANCSAGKRCENPGTCAATCVTAPLPPVCTVDANCSGGKLCCSGACITAACSSTTPCPTGFECKETGSCGAYCSLIPLKKFKITTPAFLVNGQSFTVNVKDELGTVLSGVRVQYGDENKQTDGNGSVSFVAKTGKTVVEVAKDGYQTAKIVKFIKSSGSAGPNNPVSTVAGEIQLSLVDENIFVNEEFVVIVTDDNGSPLPNATIRYGNQTKQTDEEGTVTLTAQKNVVAITASSGAKRSSLTIFPKTNPVTPDGGEEPQPEPGAIDWIAVVGGIAVVLFLIVLGLRVYYMVRRNQPANP